MATQNIPTSKATNASELLDDIVTAVGVEPKRLRMSIPLQRGGFGISADQMPSCGTVGCVAGWAIVLKGLDFQRGTGKSVTNIAGELLGLTNGQQHELFFTWDESHAEGTPEHVEDEVRLIRAFQKKYRAQLLAKKV